MIYKKGMQRGVHFFFCIVGKKCSVVTFKQEFRKKFLQCKRPRLARECAKNILYSFIGKCCSVVAVRQEFRKKFLPKCVRWHALFVLY